MKINYMSISDIIPFPRNVKKHPASQVKGIAESIDKFGFYSPIVIDENNEVIIGHGRLLAAKKLNMTEVPVVKMESLSDEDVRALRILDNKISESDWDLENLKAELNELPEFNWDNFDLDFGGLLKEEKIDFGDFGFDEDQLAKKTEAFLHGTIKQIVLYFSNDQYETTIDTLNELREKLDLESNTEVFLELLKHYERTNSI